MFEIVVERIAASEAFDSATGKRPDKMQSSITIMPYMMASGEDKIVADAIYEGLTHPGHYEIR